MSGGPMRSSKQNFFDDKKNQIENILVKFSHERDSLNLKQSQDNIKRFEKRQRKRAAKSQAN